jgi:hypothetical protein
MNVVLFFAVCLVVLLSTVLTLNETKYNTTTVLQYTR